MIRNKLLEEVRDLAYYKANAEEDYLAVPISVLRYISQLEQQENSYNDKKEFAINFSRFSELFKIKHPELYWSKNMDELLEIYENENRG